MNLQTTLQARYPLAELTVYFAFIDLCRQFELEPQKGKTHEHHICPKKQFPELEHAPENLITLHTRLHAHAHRLLAAAVPELSTTAAWIAAGHSVEARTRQGLTQKITKNRPEVKARISASSKKYFSNPEARATHSACMKISMSRPEVRARQSAALKIALARPEVRAQRSAAMKKRYEDPEYRARHSAAMKKWRG